MNRTLAAARFHSQWPEAVFLLAPAERPRVLVTTLCFPKGAPTTAMVTCFCRPRKGKKEVENCL